MKKTYYSFKLNLSINTIQENVNNLSYIIKEDIPSLLKSLINLEVSTDSDNHPFKFNITAKDSLNDSSKADYNNLKKMSDKLKIQYEELYSEYTSTGNVVYPKNFMSLNDRCIILRHKLEKDNPYLKLIYKNINKYEDSNYLPDNYRTKMKTGRTHLLKFKMIQDYLSSGENTTIDGFYNIEKEVFYLEKNKDEDKVIERANIIQTKINSDLEFTEKLSSITLIQQYEKINLSEDTKKVWFNLVYPNPDLVGDLLSSDEKPNFDLNDITKSFKSENLKVELSGSKLDVKKIEKSLSASGKQGYLQNYHSTNSKVKFLETVF